MKCVVSGSFQKFYSGIKETTAVFQKHGVEVIAPKISTIKNPNDGFVLLESDVTNDMKVIERAHLDAIKAADFLYIYNPKGYIGLSAAMELGWAVANNKPIFSLEKPTDPILGKFVEARAPQTFGSYKTK